MAGKKTDIWKDIRPQGLLESFKSLSDTYFFLPHVDLCLGPWDSSVPRSGGRSVGARRPRGVSCRWRMSGDALSDPGLGAPPVRSVVPCLLHCERQCLKRHGPKDGVQTTALSCLQRCVLVLSGELSRFAFPLAAR